MLFRNNFAGKSIKSNDDNDNDEDAEDANSMPVAWDVDDRCIKNDAIDLKNIVQSDDEPTVGTVSIWHDWIGSGSRFDVLVLTSYRFMWVVWWWCVLNQFSVYLLSICM